MSYTLRRRSETATATLGELYHGSRRLCATLEDLSNEPKIPGQTRIPAGIYPLTLVVHSGFNYRYQKRFGADWHPGIVSVEEVPGFDLIRVHIGNTHKDTAGCVLVGERTSDYRGGFLHESTKAYQRVYPLLRDAIRAGGATLEVIDPL